MGSYEKHSFLSEMETDIAFLVEKNLAICSSKVQATTE